MAGGQVVLSSDRPPGEIPDVDERLVSRLSGGLIVDVTAPDYETRVAILRANCEERHLEFKSGVLEELARFNFNNVRALQGALNRLVAAKALSAEEEAAPAKAPPRPARRDRPTGEFESFVSEVSSVVQQQVESWQARLREAIAYWNGEGYRTAVLERALTLTKAPDVAGLLATFTAAVDHLRDLERAAVVVDLALGSDPVFRDPERMAAAEDLVERALAGETPPGGPSAAFTRDAYEMGTSNQLAVHAADAVIAAPGVKYNPLLIHGASGVGKTHLLHAIGNALVQARGSRLVVACVHAQQFIDELIASIQGGTIERWRARYRSVDALLIDDVQFVADKERTQEELFLLFNEIVGAGRQVVLTSDQRPSAIPDLEARLRSRFEGGLVVPVQAPDRALREKLFARFLTAAGRESDRVTPRAAGRAAGAERAGDHRRREPAGRRGPQRRCSTRRRARAPRTWRGDAGGGRGRRRAGGRRPRSGVHGRRKDRVGVAGSRRPGDRGVSLMAIKGSLKEASLLDVLQLLSMGKKTGCLSVTHRNNFGSIYFDKGRICYAAIVNRRDRLGDILLKSGAITTCAAAAGDRRAGAPARQEAWRDPRRPWDHFARRPPQADPPADRGGRLLPVHLDAGNVQLRGGHSAGGTGFPRDDQPRVAPARGRAARGRVESHRKEDPVLRHRLRPRRGPQASSRKPGRS